MSSRCQHLLPIALGLIGCSSAPVATNAANVTPGTSSKGAPRGTISVPSVALTSDSADPRSTMRLDAVTTAAAFPVRARLVDNKVITLALPAERRHLLRVAVSLVISRRDGGEVVLQRRKFFDRETKGDELQFYLPTLPPGEYVADIRATSTVHSRVQGKDLELVDKANVEFQMHGEPKKVAPREFVLYFERDNSLKAQAIPTQATRDTLTGDRARLRVILTNNKRKRVKLQVDCYASDDGAPAHNDRVSQKRCDYVRNELVRQVDSSLNPLTYSHGEHEAYVEIPGSYTEAQKNELRPKNRVAILRVYIE